MLLANRYDSRTHFIFELLQNAEDALRRRPGSSQPKSVRFNLCSNCLVVSHFGAPFTEKDIRFICGIGESTAMHELTDIGRFGIGFKSVYALTEAPEVHSGDEHFAIDSFVWPRAIGPIQTCFGETVFRFPFRQDDGAVREEIHETLAELGLSTLLFLREIDQLEWQVDDGCQGVFLREEKLLGNSIREVTIIGQPGSGELEQESYLIFDRPVYHEGKPAGRVEIAFRLVNGVVVPVENAVLSVFFPTIVPTRFGAILQGPFRTTPSRDNIPRDDAWNTHLVQEMASLLPEALEGLRDRGFLTASALSALPIHSARFSSHEMFRPLYDSCVGALQTKPLLPCTDGCHHRAESVRVGRTKEIRDLFPPAELGRLFGREQPLQWISGDVTRDRMPDLRNYLVISLRITEIEPESIISRLDDPSVLAAQPIAWMVRLYEFLNRQESVWDKTGLFQKPVIRLSDGRQVAPFRNGNPQAYLPGKSPTGFSTVHSEICSNKDALAFLKKLNIKEPDPVDDVIENVLPKYAGTSRPGTEEYSSDLGRIIGALKTNLNDQRERLVKRLKQTAFVVATNCGDGRRVWRKPGTAYFPTKQLRALFDGVAGVWLADIEFGKHPFDAMRGLLRACACEENLAPVRIETTFPAPELEKMRQNAGYARTTARESIDDHTLSGLDALLNHLVTLSPAVGAERSKILWESLGDAVKDRGYGLLDGKYSWYYGTNRSCPINAAFIRTLNVSEWVPGPNGALCRPSDVIFGELDPAWREDVLLASRINFRPPAVIELARTIGLEPAALDLMKQHGITEARLKELLKLNQQANPNGGDVISTVGDATAALLGNLSEPTPPLGNDDPEYATGGAGRSTGSGDLRNPSTSGPSGSQGGRNSNSSGTDAGSPPSSGPARPAFHTYVAVHADEELPDLEGLNHAERMGIERKAIDLILAEEPSLNTTPTHNPGFDLFEGTNMENAVRFVEVKAKKGMWAGPVAMSRTQFRKALEEGARYSLYVVENAGDAANARIHRIPDPARNADYFSYDPGWAKVAALLEGRPEAE